jgi:hypothetical protein
MAIPLNMRPLSGRLLDEFKVRAIEEACDGLGTTSYSYLWRCNLAVE